VVSGVTPLNPFVAKDDVEGKVSILDIRARDDPGRHYLVEMQQLVRPGFAKRILYYWSGTHTEQLLKGQRYEMLLATHAVCFLNETLLPDAVYHHCFHVFDEEHGVLLCKDLEIHLLELSKFDLAVEQVQTPLERWCYFFRHGAALGLEDLPATLDVPVIRKAVEVLMKISQSELERQRYLERQRAEQDAASWAEDMRVAQEDLRVAKEKARVAEENARAAQENAQVARRMGFVEGIEKGKVIGRIQLLQQLLQLPETSGAELDQLAEADLLRLEDSLQQQLSSKRQANGTSPTDKT
jgi:predicted transposase/invertase (TIGR01784 family)